MADQYLVFDVNETLLDLAPLDAVFDTLFSESGLRHVWFATLLHWSTVTTLTGRYRDFARLAGDCLDTLAARRCVELDDSARRDVFETIQTLPPHREVPATLERLVNNGFELIALTNSTQATVDAQFEHTGLRSYFQHVLSVDAAQCFKPHPNAYAVAAGTLGCANDQLRLIAAHDWDVTGAIRAGLKGAYVARGQVVLNTAGECPDIVGSDLSDVADQLLAQAR